MTRADTRPGKAASRFHGDPMGSEHRGPPSRFIVFRSAQAALATLVRYAYGRKIGSNPAIPAGVSGLEKNRGTPGDCDGEDTCVGPGGCEGSSGAGQAGRRGPAREGGEDGAGAGLEGWWASFRLESRAPGFAGAVAGESAQPEEARGLKALAELDRHLDDVTAYYGMTTPMMLGRPQKSGKTRRVRPMYLWVREPHCST